MQNFIIVQRSFLIYLAEVLIGIKSHTLLRIKSFFEKFFKNIWIAIFDRAFLQEWEPVVIAMEFNIV